MGGEPNINESLTKVALILVIALSAVAGAAALSNPQHNRTVSPQDNVTFTVEAQQNQDVDLFLLPPKSSVEKFQMNYSNGSYNVTLGEENFQKKGRYRYKFSAGTTEFPSSGYLGMTVSALNQTLKNKTLNSSNTGAELTGSATCEFKSGDFSCGHENFQSYMIFSSAVQYYVNTSSYNREKFYNFTLSSYGSTFSNCNQEVGDFSCNDDDFDNSFNVSSGTRQGTLIYSLWESFSLVGNSSVKNLAINYTQGSAQECDVWSSDFKCNVSVGDSGRAQGSMALGYWSAYEVTGNETYKKFARKLTTTNYSHPRIISAYLRAYSFTSNESYLGEARNRTLKWLEKCPNCSDQEFVDLKNALWRGYRVTGEFGYYRNAVNLTAYSTSRYCSWNDTSCSAPNIQGLSTLGYWRAYMMQKDVNRSIFNPQVESETIVGQNLTIDVGMDGKVRSPELLYRVRSSNSSWSRCEVGFFEGCTIDGSNLSAQAPYSYKFRLGNNTTFPVNGSFVFAPSLVKDNLIDEAEVFSSSDPENLCSPFTGDFSCEDDPYQAGMIDGYSQLGESNSSRVSRKFVLSLVSYPYVTNTNIGFIDYCTESNGYIACESGPNPPKPSGFEGSTRQGSMIYSLFEAYEATGNGSAYERAMNYTLGGAEDCDVWGRSYTKSFNCSSVRGQAAMIKGYLKAYEVTGNRTFRRIALNLTENGVNMSASPRLGSVLWKASSYFNESYRNLSIREAAENVSESYSGFCAGNCTSSQYLSSASLFQNSYLYSGGNFSTDYRQALLNTTSSGECGPYKKDSTCSSPGDQGSMIDMLWESAYTMPVKIKVEDSFNLSTDAVKVGDNFQATCSVENQLQNTTLLNTNFELSLGDGLSAASNNTTYFAGDLGYNNSSSVTWNITADSTGLTNASCILDSDSGYRDTLIRGITVEKKEQKSNPNQENQESSGGGGGGSSIDTGGLGGLLDDTPENKTLIYENRSDIAWNRSFLESLGINTTYRSFTYNRSCFSAVRRLYPNTSELEIEYSCSTDGVVVLDRLPANFTERDTESGYVVEKFLNVSDENLTFSYGKRGNTSLFGAPLVLSSDYSLPPLNVSLNWSQNLTRANETLSLRVELNRPVNCQVRRNGRAVFSERTDYLNRTVNLTTGNNTVEVSCGSYSRTLRSTVQPEKKKTSEGFLPLLLLSLFSFTALGTLVYYRGALASLAGQVQFNYYFWRFENAMEKRDQATAIEIYSKLSGLRDENVGKILLESDLELMRGLRIYLILDLLQDDEVRDEAIPVGDDIEELVNRFLSDIEDDRLEKLIMKKLSDMPEN